MTTTVRKQTTGDRLAVGDWLAPGELLDGAAEVLFVHTYPASANRSRDDDGTHVQLVVRQQGTLATSSDIVSGHELFDLATDEELAELREAAERAKKIADIRAFADWLEQNAWAPVPYSFDASVHLDERHVGGPGVADSLAQVRDVASRLGVQPEDRLDDRTAVRKGFGSVEYDVIAWHPNGRPAEPRPEVERDDIDPDSSMEAHYDAEAEAGIFSRARHQELLWKRDVGTFGGLAGALDYAHARALVEDNDREKTLVERSMTVLDEGRIANPKLARFMAVREDRRRSESASAE